MALAELINNSDDSDAYTLQTVGASGARLDNENVVAPGAPHAVVGAGPIVFHRADLINRYMSHGSVGIWRRQMALT